MVAALLFVLVPRQATPVRTVDLPATAVALDQEFTRIAAVRELADQRVLVLDAGEKRLVVMDFRNRSVITLGREGRGPGEYTQPNALHALPADSTLLVDAIASRWLLLHGASIVQTIPPEYPGIERGARSPLGADAHGNVLATRAFIDPRRLTSIPESGPDSVNLLRVARSTGRADTLGRLKARRTRIVMRSAGPVGPGTSISIVNNPLAAGEQALLLPDGWIAIARLGPYRVDWIDPQRRHLAGGALPFVSVPVDTREKRGAMQRIAAARGQPAADPDTVPDWPTTLPPFLGEALLGAPDGRLWIRRTPVSRIAGTIYDVIDRQSRLLGRVRMKEQQRVVGFGTGFVYVAESDDDGLQFLRRHPLPKF